jgi:hypothetical protein
MGPRVQFICQSSVCRRQREMEIPIASERGQISNPRCICGSEMKRVYSKPVVRELSKAEAAMRLGNREPRKIRDKAIRT